MENGADRFRRRLEELNEYLRASEAIRHYGDMHKRRLLERASEIAQLERLWNTPVDWQDLQGLA